MEYQYFVSLLETRTQDQWHPLEALYITIDEAELVKRAIQQIIENRHNEDRHD